MVGSGLAENVGQLWTSVGQCSRLVEEESPASFDLLKDLWLLDDYASSGGERNAANDGHGNTNEKWTRSGDHDYSQEPLRGSADQPADHAE